MFPNRQLKFSFSAMYSNHLILIWVCHVHVTCIFKMQVGLKGEFSMIYALEKKGCAEWSGMQTDNIQSPFTWYKVSWLFTCIKMVLYLADGNMVLIPYYVPLLLALAWPDLSYKFYLLSSGKSFGITDISIKINFLLNCKVPTSLLCFHYCFVYADYVWCPWRYQPCCHWSWEHGKGPGLGEWASNWALLVASSARIWVSILVQLPRSLQWEEVPIKLWNAYTKLVLRINTFSIFVSLVVGILFMFYYYIYYIDKHYMQTSHTLQLNPLFLSENLPWTVDNTDWHWSSQP